MSTEKTGRPHSIFESVFKAHGLRRVDHEDYEALKQNDDVEIGRLKAALEIISQMHIPDQPAGSAGDELEWAQRHVANMRRVALQALTQESPQP